MEILLLLWIKSIFTWPTWTEIHSLMLLRQSCQSWLERSQKSGTLEVQGSAFRITVYTRVRRTWPGEPCNYVTSLLIGRANQPPRFVTNESACYKPAWPIRAGLACRAGNQQLQTQAGGREASLLTTERDDFTATLNKHFSLSLLEMHNFNFHS